MRIEEIDDVEDHPERYLSPRERLRRGLRILGKHGRRVAIGYERVVDTARGHFHDADFTYLRRLGWERDVVGRMYIFNPGGWSDDEGLVPAAMRGDREVGRKAPRPAGLVSQHA